MNAKLITVLSVLCMGLSVHAFSDSVWVVSTVGEPGQLMSVEVWMEYEGGGSRDSVSAFDILLSFDARVCTVEAYALGQDFSKWTNQSRIDNRGIQEPPAVSKIDLSAFTFGPPVGVPFVARGRHLAATVDFRILKTVRYGHFTYIDTLLQAFAPPLYLGFVDKGGANTYLPKYAGGWITALAERGDVGPIAITSPPDTVEAKGTYIPSVTVKNFEADSTGPVLLICTVYPWADTVEIPSVPGSNSVTAQFSGWQPQNTGMYSITIFTRYDRNTANDTLSKTVLSLPAEE